MVPIRGPTQRHAPKSFSALFAGSTRGVAGHSCYDVDLDDFDGASGL